MSKKHKPSQSFLARKREKARLKKLKRMKLKKEYLKQKEDYYGDIE